MIIAYALACSAVWAVLQTLSEMTISFPTTGNYIDYADRWVDPALAFGAGFAEWLGNLSQKSRFHRITTDARHRLVCSHRRRGCLLQHSHSILGRRFIPSCRILWVIVLSCGTNANIMRFLVTIFLAVSCALFILPNKYFAWFEYFTSLVKIFLFLLILTVSLAIVCGAGPGGYVHDGAYWRDLPAFKNGFSV